MIVKIESKKMTEIRTEKMTFDGKEIVMHKIQAHVDDLSYSGQPTQTFVEVTVPQDKIVQAVPMTNMENVSLSCNVTPTKSGRLTITYISHEAIKPKK